MRDHRFWGTVVLAVLSVCLPAAVFAGQGWEVEYSSITGSDEAKSIVLQMDDDHIRLVPKGEDAEIIITPDGFIVVNHERKENMTMSFDELETAMSGMSAVMEKMQAQLDEAKKGMTEDQIKAMEKFMPKPDIPAAVEVEQKYAFKKTKDSGTVAGLKAKKAEVYEKDALVGEVWLTSEIPVKPLVRAAERMIATLPPQMRQNLELAEMFVGLDGFPLKMVSLDEDPQEIIEAVRAEKVKFGSDTWKGPGNYDNKSMSDQMNFEMDLDK